MALQAALHAGQGTRVGRCGLAAAALPGALRLQLPLRKNLDPSHLRPLHSGRHFDFALDATTWCLYAYILLSALVFALSNRAIGYARCFLLVPVFVAVFIFRRVSDE